MSLPRCKTKIVCTIGPACESEEMIEKLIRAGMNVARLNFSHGDFEWHGRIMSRIRGAAGKANRHVAIMADLPGPKIRIGTIAGESVMLTQGETFTLTTDDEAGDASRAAVNFSRLPQVTHKGDTIYLNDGLIELEVEAVTEREVRCRVMAGGELRSRKGLNLPGIDLGIGAFTESDRGSLEFALSKGADIVSQSFVGAAADVEAVRAAAAEFGREPLVVAKIERTGALEVFEEILAAADGIMIARGDLGVEIPIERIAVVQKDLIARAVTGGKPVITATQMLESMTSSRRPTRAEATDVANAVFDGTDAVMLSGETASGRHPLASVEMLVRIAAYAEGRDSAVRKPSPPRAGEKDPVEVVAESVREALEGTDAAAVFVPTVSGATARRIARFRPNVWIVAVTPSMVTYRQLLFSRGVFPVHEPDYPEDWNGWVRQRVSEYGLKGAVAILTEGPSAKHPDANHRMEIIELRRRGRRCTIRT